MPRRHSDLVIDGPWADRTPSSNPPMRNVSRHAYGVGRRLSPYESKLSPSKRTTPTAPASPLSPSNSDSEASIHQSSDSEDDSLAINTSRSRSTRQNQTTPPPSPKPTPRLGCPFAIRDERTYKHCGQHDFEGYQGLKEHLLRRHLCVPYCCICGATFDHHVERNAHIASRTCQLTETPPVFEGIGEGAIDELDALISDWDRNASISPSDEEKEALIWSLLFPVE
ncbi:hypothetical protein B0H67DRAFT_573013 [Lasiosphaeris hirsuta]|uniref:C2H2-type domain-containing protein n=1 Tax=Lasiosphaeris hirsuta TaxID=260670 RepID=A0AA40DWX2_9PEZI|nr:hypothetical protein B0H67DRAFT_573013 [Lasiosphaeris hirsuta]